MTTGEAVAMYRQALAHGEDPAEAAAIVDGAIGGYAGRNQALCTEARLQTLESNVAWLVRNMAKLTMKVMQLAAIGEELQKRQKEVEGTPK